MIFSVAPKSRNYNFLELIEKYNILIDNHQNNLPLTNKEQYSFIDDLIGGDSVDLLLTALFNEQENFESENLGLLEWDGVKYYLAKKKKILPPPTKEEAAYVNYLLNKGDFDLFLNDSEKNLLQDNINTYFDNIKIKIPDINSYFFEKGASISSDNLAKIKDNFNLIFGAIKKNKAVHFKYFYNGRYEILAAKPVKFVYSQLDRRMKAKMHIGGFLKTFYLSNMSEMYECDDNIELSNKIDEEKELIITCKNEANIVERITARFSDYQKEVHFNEKKNTVEYHIFYNDNINERNRVLIRLRYLSSRITVLSDEKEILKDEAKQLLEIYNSDKN